MSKPTITGPILAAAKELKQQGKTYPEIVAAISETFHQHFSWQAFRSALTKTNDSAAGSPASGGQGTRAKQGVTRGILILALGHPYYGELAANLAASIRRYDAHIPIALAWHGEALRHLNDGKKKLFTKMLQVPNTYVTKHAATRYFKAKTYLYDLSPFDETVYLDADMLWMQPIAKLFEVLNDFDFTISHRDVIDLEKGAIAKQTFLWADWKQIKTAYKFTGGKLYGLHSEVIVFRKTPKIKTFFETVKQVYDAPGVKSTAFAGDIADELAFAIAMVKHDIHPHQRPWVPVYWYLKDHKLGTTLQFVKANYQGYSVGGNGYNTYVTQRYNILSQDNARQLGILHPFKLKAKRNWLPERKTL